MTKNFCFIIAGTLLFISLMFFAASALVKSDRLSKKLAFTFLGLGGISGALFLVYFFL